MQEADWMRMLDQLREALQQSAADVTRHEQTLASPLLTSDLSEERQINWRRALERFADRLQESNVQVERAEQSAAKAVAGLAEHEELLASFRVRLVKARAQLAKVPAPV
jgi:hypothetical protein